MERRLLHLHPYLHFLGGEFPWGNVVRIFSQCNLCVSRTPLGAAGHKSAQMLEAGIWLRCSPRTVVVLEEDNV